MAKIVLFADGTGNARTAQFRTNVWKLYNALDSRPGTGQIAYYHDGVGTSGFAPLKLLGGIFGYGLARNVRALYAFLCRSWTDEADEIHLFGFSRGAFTVRILAGLIATQGVRHITDEAELASWVDCAYRRNRHRISLAQVDPVRRMLFSAFAALFAIGSRTWDDQAPKPDIEFVGVWDTVAAYGGPIVEMVRGFDRWVWPLSMPDYKLSPKVRRARHALALDEEREAFLPLPWDEVGLPPPASTPPPLPPSQRIRQVWFAGVHSDVGGGYPDEGLSNIPLAWMLNEAKDAGLKFMPEIERAIREAANAWAPMHDSRSGVGVAYRYQPRSINALMGLTPHSPLRDPASGEDPLLSRVIVHSSVRARVGGPASYAPIVLPTAFEDDTGQRVTLPSAERDRIWDLVSVRRWMQRLLLVTVFLALFAPLYPTPAPMNLIDQGLAAPLDLVLGLIPLVPAWMKAAYAGAGSWLIIFAALIAIWLALGERQRIRIDKVSAGMWAGQGVASGEAAGVAPAPRPSRRSWLLTLRRVILRRLRWQLLPAAFGLGFYLVGAFLLVVAVNQFAMFVREMRGDICAGQQRPSMTFATSEPCHRLGTPVHAGHHYSVTISVGQGWVDKPVKTSPAGFTYVQSFSQQFADRHYAGALEGLAAHFFGIALRREISAHWFQPVIGVREPNDRWLYKAILSPRLGDDGAYHAHFVAPADGETWIYVNDAALPWGDGGSFYANNCGSAKIEITPEN